LLPSAGNALLPLDDCLYALQATIPQLTRSSMHRCLERHGISRLPEVEDSKPGRKKFQRYPIGYFHVDLAEVRTAEGKLYLLVARPFAFVELVERADMRAAAAFLEALIAALPYRIHTVLTDSGILFADLPKNRRGPTARFRGHPFDRICLLHGIDHRLTKPNHPWTNGQVERMIRTIKEARFSATTTTPMTSCAVISATSSPPIALQNASRLSPALPPTSSSANAGKKNPIDLLSIRSIKCRD
jgi:transposase InsO family protein